MSAKYFALPLCAVAAFVLTIAVAGSAVAGITQEVGESGAYSLGLGLRASYDSIEDAADSGTDSSDEFNLGSLRIYGGGQLN
ncbi:MAG: porin, partial [Deltaproteobacteria bacterium]